MRVVKENPTINIPKFHEKKDLEFCLANYTNFANVEFSKNENFIEQLKNSKIKDYLRNSQTLSMIFEEMSRKSNDEDIQKIVKKQSTNSGLRVSADSSGMELVKESYTRPPHMKIDVRNQNTRLLKESSLNKDLEIMKNNNLDLTTQA